MTRRPLKRATRIDELGIAHAYLDAGQQWRTTSEQTRRLLRAAMKPSGTKHVILNGKPQTETDGSPLFVPVGQALRVERAAEVQLEDGTILKAPKKLPADLPPGYHYFR